MKATGIIRRIDDLGRVLIPKEIRKSYNLREGDPLEIFTTDEGVVFAPYKEPKVKKSDIAREWLANHQQDMTFFSAKFTIEDTKTICEVIRRSTRMIGESKCNPLDTYDPAIGMVVAFCRASGMTMPGELLED